MLYYIFRFLERFDIPGSHIWHYISFRSLLALILSLIISAWFGERFIKFMKRRKISEVQREANIDPFGVQKKGVPTMGGIIILVSILVPVLLFGRMRNIYLILMIVTTIWLGFLGFLDDYIKIFRKNKVLTIVDRREAIRTACMLAKKGDVILVAGKGHEDYQEIEGVKHHFDDREVVREIFQE